MLRSTGGEILSPVVKCCGLHLNTSTLSRYSVCAQSHTMDQEISKGQQASEKQSSASLWLCEKLFFRESPCQMSFQDFCFRAISERLSDWSLNVLNRILYNRPLQEAKRVGHKTAAPSLSSWIGEIRWLLMFGKACIHISRAQWRSDQLDRKITKPCTWHVEEENRYCGHKLRICCHDLLLFNLFSLFKWTVHTKM